VGCCALRVDPARRRGEVSARPQVAAGARSTRADSAPGGTASAGHSLSRVSIHPPCSACAAGGRRLDAGQGAQPQKKDGGGGGTVPDTDRKALFCHQCQPKKLLKVAFYLQATTPVSEDNRFFARIFLLGHNVDLEIDTAAGVIPTVYNEEKKQFAKTESVADLCDALKGLEKQGTFPPSSGTLAAVFLPFGKQLRGDAGDTLGWHIPNVSAKCKDFVDPPLKASRVVVIDSEPETPTPKVLLHEIGHAVGNVDLGDSAMIIGPANAKGTKEAPIGCQPDRPDNLMTAAEVEKFCKGSF
jgi:hypothetical protein